MAKQHVASMQDAIYRQQIRVFVHAQVSEITACKGGTEVDLRSLGKWVYYFKYLWYMTCSRAKPGTNWVKEQTVVGR